MRQAPAVRIEPETVGMATVAEQFERDSGLGLSSALIAVGCAQILGWCMLAGVFVSFFTFMGGPQPIADVVLGLAMVALAFGCVIASAGYTAFVSGHNRPITQTVAAIAVYPMTVWVGLLILGRIREEFMLAAPLVAVGAMLAILLPDAPAHWKAARLMLPGLIGILTIVGLTSLAPRYDASYGVLMLGLLAGLALSLAAIRALEGFRERSNRTSERTPTIG